MIDDIILENSHFVLRVGSDAIPKSLIHKASGRECLEARSDLAFFSLTQPRPFENEVKLAYPNKQTTYQANRLRQEGDRLFVGFEIIPCEAEVRVNITDEYISFILEDIIVRPKKNLSYRCFSPPAVESFRLLQLPVKKMERFGQWLNVMWDDEVAVNVLATQPEAIIDSENHSNCRCLTADALREVRLAGTEAALIVSDSEHFLDAVDQLEQDYDLPRGVQSRRDPRVRASSYWAGNVNPTNVDEHIRYCRKCGYTQMTVYFACLFKGWGYEQCGDYGENMYVDAYPEGHKSLREMLQKIKAAGITPGLHFLHPHIGLKSTYVTPVADSRLHLTKHFTLAKPLGLEDDTVYVQQNPRDSVMLEGYRILQFGGELISYEGYSTQRPYRFTGCKRGALETIVTEHPQGQIGGLLDISEFEAMSCYADQDSDLQEEVSAQLGEVYAQGFEYLYYDGAEGAIPPYAYHVANSQYITWKQMKPAPVYCEAAAKSHFSWHMLSGGNAFDIFAPGVFKEKTRRHPADEAPRMQQDFTRLNFGWWGFGTKGYQPDHWEYGNALAAAWDCPVTIQFALHNVKNLTRLDDMLEVLRRWEHVRLNGLLTQEEKRRIQENPMQEYIMLIDENQDYRLQPYTQIETEEPLRAFLFERNGKRWVVYWKTEGEGDLALDIPDMQVYEELYEAPISLDGPGTVPVGDRRYLVTDLSEEEVRAAFAKAKLM